MEEPTNIPSENVLLKALGVALDDSQRAMLLFDADGKVLFITQAAMDIFSVTDRDKFLATGFSFRGDLNFDMESAKELFSNRDVTVNVNYDCDLFRSQYPEIDFRTGIANLSLFYHNIFDNDCNLLYTTVEVADQSLAVERKDREKNLKDSISILLQTGGISIWLYDIFQNRRILIQGLHLFPALSHMTDYMRHIHPDDAIILTRLIDKIKRGEKQSGHEVIRFIDNTSSPDYLYLDVHCVALVERGRLAFIAFMTVDVTEKTQYQTELKMKESSLSSSELRLESLDQLFHTLIDRLPCLFFMKDADDDFRYIWVNEMFCSRIGKSRAEIIGHNDYEILSHDKDPKYYRDIDKQACDQGYVTTTEETTWSGNKLTWQTTKYVVRTKTKETILVGLSLDITSISEAYDKIKAAKECAELSEKLKSTYLANMSHEIRTPLNSIIGFASLLSEGDRTPQENRFIKIIMDSGDLLLNIINNILDISKIEAGVLEFHFTQIILPDLFDTVKQTFLPRISEGVELMTDFPQVKFIATTDKSRLVQVINNFMSNAIKYTKKGQITLGYQCEFGILKVYVQDTGNGIKDENKDKVFTRFERFDTVMQGTGLGLSICKLLVEKLGGKISFESEFGKGSKFSFWIPCEISEEVDDGIPHIGD